MVQRCTDPGCTKSAVHSKSGTGDSNKCIAHGGADRCTEPGCTKSAVHSKSGTGNSSKCTAHGGADRCTEPGCTRSAVRSKSGTGDSNKCAKHGGADRCTEPPGCTKSAVHSKSGTGDSSKCKVHGGADRCTEPGCTKSAQHSKSGTGDNSKCAKHGGSDRCTEPGCTKSAVHSKSGTGDSNKCAKHGGADRCTEPGCTKSAFHSKSGTGDSNMCRAHGGSDRCELECCTSMHGVRADVATGYHPETKQGMCTFSCRQMVNGCEDAEDRTQLMLHFGFKKLLVMRGEHAFYHALNLLVPKLRESERFLDASLFSNGLGKRKSRDDKRPDYYHYFADGSKAFVLHGEYDETPDHEDSDDRLAMFAEISNCIGTTYVFRIQAHHYTDKALCVQKTHKQHSYWHLTDAGRENAREVAAVVQERLAWISQGLAPSAERPWKVYL